MLNRVLVIGGSGGIGAGIAEVLTENGYDVVSSYCNNLNCQSGNNIKLDLLDKDNALYIDFSSYHAIIFSAGRESLCSLSDIDINEFNDQIMMQLHSPLMIIKKLLSSKNKLRQIIFISSIAGTHLHEATGLYAFIKSSVISLTRILANELKQNNISVNAIAPNWCKTSMADRVIKKKGIIKKDVMSHMINNEFIKPKEIGLVCCKLLDLSINITGQIIEVNPCCN